MDETMLSKLKEFHEEEQRDMEKYYRFAESIEKDYPKLAGVFRDIAREEQTHADLIKQMVQN